MLQGIRYKQMRLSANKEVQIMRFKDVYIALSD